MNLTAYYVLCARPLIEAVEEILADTRHTHPHLVNQSGWRNHPGHDATGNIHVDELFLTSNQLPPELIDGMDWSPPIFIVTALTYLVDVDAELAPTVVVPGSFRAMRPPEPGEMSWGGQKPCESKMCIGHQ